MSAANFDSIVRTHQAMVYSIAYHFFHNTALAEEVAQEVFLQLFGNRRLWDSGSHLVAWLRKTTAHRCIDVLRRGSYRNEVQLEELPDLPAISEEADPLLREKLQRLVASLPEIQRAVVILRYTEDMDVREIGRTLNIPVRTVWSHLQRAAALLREKASRLFGEERNESVR